MRKEIRTGKDFETADAMPIENFVSIRKYIWANRVNSLRFLKSRVFADNRESFKELWGKPLFRWVGGSENRQFHVWVKQFDGCQLAILTAKDKGTCYEIVPDEKTSQWNLPKQKYEKDIIAWLEELIKAKEMQLK